MTAKRHFDSPPKKKKKDDTWMSKEWGRVKETVDE